MLCCSPNSKGSRALAPIRCRKQSAEHWVVNRAVARRLASCLVVWNRSSAASSSPLMSLLGPIANAVAGQVGISPSIATTVAATALHYLASSHPASGTSAPLNLGNVSQQMASGGVSQETLHSSGMVNAVAQATGLSQAQAAASLNSTFNYMQQHAAEHKAKEEHRKKRREG
jgi:hypothetical protein